MKKKHGKLAVVLAVALILSAGFTGCGSDKEQKTEAKSEAKTEAMSETKTEAKTETYVHGEDGYYSLYDEYQFPLVTQRGGTCWVHGSAATMELHYYKKNGKVIDIDPYELVDAVYAKDKEEGIMLREGTDPLDFGGWEPHVAFEMENGIGDYVLDNMWVYLPGEVDLVKQHIREYGGLSVSVPDKTEYKHLVHGYYTINQPTKDIDDYDHTVTIIGWDDHFPKDYFTTPATVDGAWIAYNSNLGNQLYYISYSVELFFAFGMSVTEKYKRVLAYDTGWSLDEEDALWAGMAETKGHMKSFFGKNTKMANVFHDSGKLGAVGTYSYGRNEKIKIEIYDAKLENVLYTQEAMIDHIGYQAIELDEPVEVNDFAVAITFDSDAPVEGQETVKDDDRLEYRPKSKAGQSYIYKDGKWIDLTTPEGKKAAGVGFDTNNACIKALMLD